MNIGQKVSILNRCYTGAVIVEGKATIVGKQQPNGMWPVVFENEDTTYYRHIEIAAQHNPAEFVRRFNQPSTRVYA